MQQHMRAHLRGEVLARLSPGMWRAWRARGSPWQSSAYSGQCALQNAVQGQLNAMTSGLRVLKTALERGHPEAEAGPRASADEPEAALQREAALRATVEQWQSLRRDSQTRQLATFVKNLDSFFDIMINIVHMRENFEVRRREPCCSAVISHDARTMPHRRTDAS